MNFAINTILTILLAVIPSFATTESLNTFYKLLLATSGIYGASVALLQVSLYGVAGSSAANTSSFMVGIGFSAMSVNLLRILLLVVEPDIVTGAYIFFGITAFLNLISTVVAY